jgi:hypothetical protein
MSKLPPFSLSQKAYSIIRPAPATSPVAKELVGADELTLAMLADLLARIEAAGDKATIIRAIGDFRGVIVAAHEAAFVLWDKDQRRLIWMFRDQVHGRDWPSLVSAKLLGHLPELELGSDWRFELCNGEYVGVCQHSPWLHKSISPEAQRFAERYNNERPAPVPKLKKTKTDDEGTLTHALRPHAEELSL